MAVLGSLAIAALSVVAPTSLAPASAGDDAPRWTADTDSQPERDRDATSAGDPRSASEDEDDDLDDLDDERDVDGDELLAIVEPLVHDWAPLVTTPRFWLHAPSAPDAPHPELSHRPPIAG